MTNKTEKEQFLKLIDKYLEGKTSLEELKLLLNYYESFQKKNDWVEALGTEKSIKNKMLKSILDSLKDEKTKKPIIISASLYENKYMPEKDLPKIMKNDIKIK